MKTLKTFEPLNPKSEYYSPDFARMIEEDFTKPLGELGFKPIGAISTIDKNAEAGAHIIQYKHDGVTQSRLHWVTNITDTFEEGYNTRGTLLFGTLVLTLVFSE